LVRDDEINRLTRYAQGMGVSVRFVPYRKGIGADAQWTLDNTEITVFVRTRTSKLGMVLSLIHEIGHAKHYVNSQRTVPADVEKALTEEGTLKEDRRKILEFERAGTEYWLEIYRDTNCSFPIERLYREKEFDIWMYEASLETGRDPTKKEQKARVRELKQKFRKLEE
jgi:hypothetical protein